MPIYQTENHLFKITVDWSANAGSDRFTVIETKKTFEEVEISHFETMLGAMDKVCKLQAEWIKALIEVGEQ